MPIAAPDLPQTQAVIIEMINAFRAENQLGAVAPNPQLQMAATAFANYLAKSGEFAHTADGRQPSERATAAGYQYCIVVENLAMHKSNRGFETSDLAYQAVNGWKNSPAHRANMLMTHVTETGIGIAKADGGDPKFVTVQLFGRPNSFKYKIGIENLSGTTITYTLGDQKNTIAHSMLVTHTDCVPMELSFAIGKVTSKFEAHDGETFVLSRGGDGKPRVSLDIATVPTAPAWTTFVSAKTVKPAR